MSEPHSLVEFPARTTPEQRRIIREIVGYLKSDLYDRVESPEAAMTWRSPLGVTMLLSPRQDGTGWAGEYRSLDGKVGRATSWVDVQWLEEFLP